MIMTEYIERRAVLDKLEKAGAICELGKCLIEDFPAADVVEVVHGHWNIRCESHHDNWTGETDEEFYLECSECGRRAWDVNQLDAMNGNYRAVINAFPYCHCGAKMEG